MFAIYINIRMLRNELGLTQTDLAKRLGYADKSMIAKIEKGNIDLPLSKVFEFADALGVTASDLLGWSDQSNTVDADSDNFPFTPLEKDLVTHYRAADPTTQGIVRTILKVEDKEEEKGISVS